MQLNNQHLYVIVLAGPIDTDTRSVNEELNMIESCAQN